MFAPTTARTAIRPLMESETYRGYSVWGHAIRGQEDILKAERFAASGTITRYSKMFNTSGVLGVPPASE